MSIQLYDTNAWVGHWPFAPVGHPDVATLRKHWKAQGVTGGLVSSLEALWLLNPAAVNTDLIKATQRIAGVDPLPILNLLDPAWEEQLATLLKAKSVKAVRFAPGYGGWKLSDKRAVAAATQIVAQGRKVVLTARLVDERFKSLQGRQMLEAGKRLHKPKSKSEYATSSKHKRHYARAK